MAMIDDLDIRPYQNVITYANRVFSGDDVSSADNGVPPDVYLGVGES